MNKKGQHGEPVKHEESAGNSGRLFIGYGNQILAHFYCEETADRAEACMNALNGLDPDKLAGLITAVKKIISEPESEFCLSEQDRNRCGLCKLITKLEITFHALTGGE